MNHFDVKSRERERAFLKRIERSGGVFHTGSGRRNIIVEVTPKVVYLRTEQSKKPIRLSREKFRQAISYLFQVRTSTRRELESFSKFSSALVGLLRLVFADISTVRRTVRGLLRITLNGVRFCFAGVDRAPEDLRLIKMHGGTTVLMSYFHLRNDRTAKFKEHVKSLGLQVLLDSGEFSRYVAALKGKETRPVRVEEYAEFIHEHKDILIGAINLDSIGDAVASKRNAEYLRKCGIDPIEVWHCQSPFSALDELVRQDQAIIAIGGSAILASKQRREIFTEVFERYPAGVNFHLLGGSFPFITEFPWFSADSSSWLIGRMFKKLVTPAKQMKAPAGWGPKECLVHNIQELSRMEENYDRAYQLSLLLQPVC